jgi:hypothetical protein
MGIKAKLSQQVIPQAKVSTLGSQVKVPAVGIQGIQSGAIGSISTLSDVDLTNTEDGSLLIYTQATTRWTASRNLNAQDMDGGNF